MHKQKNDIMFQVQRRVGWITLFDILYKQFLIYQHVHQEQMKC